ncbi:MAG: hypothetical protein JSU72_07430 [Deltaproteobacteria bacterium]|nr:MAG: hypothetical protein JSU72_07430 [Deltaproteobacteria bacterium]
MTLKCAHCGEVFGEETCSACQGSVPQGSRYCCWCGENLSGSEEIHRAGEWTGTEDEDGPIDFENRILCSDGTCIGVIGPDGLCKECGQPYTDDSEEG